MSTEYKIKETDSIPEDYLPEIVYKYRNWNNKYHKSIINDFAFYFSAPSDFEDEHDCVNPTRYDLLSKDERDKVIKHNLDDSWDRRTRRKKEQEIRKNLSDKKHYHRWVKETKKLIDERTAVLSLTYDCENKCMWNKYADNGSGFCIGIQLPDDESFWGIKGNVTYVDKLPIIKPVPLMTLDEQHIYRIMYKEKKWSFEREVRLHSFREFPFKKNERVRRVSNQYVKEIIFGYNMTQDHKNEILRILQEKKFSDLKLFEMKLDIKDDKLKKVPIDNTITKVD